MISQGSISHFASLLPLLECWDFGDCFVGLHRQSEWRLFSLSKGAWFFLRNPFRFLDCLTQLTFLFHERQQVWRFLPEPDGKKPSPPEILVGLSLLPVDRLDSLVSWPLNSLGNPNIVSVNGAAWILWSNWRPNTRSYLKKRRLLPHSLSLPTSIHP